MNKKWWKEGVVYQIYPRSYKDSTGNGVGDLRGIIEKLDYIQSLGVTIIWLNPIYTSPNDDNGYDISDYKNIMSEFGTMSDFDDLLWGLHRRGIRLIMDLVVNHSSDEHNWFIHSKESKNNPYRDYYIWKDPKYDKTGTIMPPNNWGSVFGGPAWKYDDTTNQYFLHIFSKKQPDLNWDNQVLRNEIFSMMNWWFDKGIDGFRMDVINMISKYPDFPDYNNNIAWLDNKTFMNGPNLHTYLKEMYEKSLKKYDVMTVGECFGLPLDEGKKMAGEDAHELSMVFQMEHVDLGSGPYGKWDIVPWKLTSLKDIFNKWYVAMEECNGWNSIFLMNHDQPRSVSKFGNDKKYRVESAKMLATMKLTLKGTPYMYQGEEIAMTNIAIDTISDYKDLEILNHYKEAIERGEKHEKLLSAYNYKGRDNARTPMQWNAEENAGFTTGTPWLKVNPNHKEINVINAENDANSVLHYYRTMIALRNVNQALIYGTFEIFDYSNEKIFAYFRKLENNAFFIMLNFTENKVRFTLPDSIAHSKVTVIISNYPKPQTLQTDSEYELQAYEAIVFKM